jgi:hypothetical protein
MLAARRVPSEDGAETVRPEQTVTEMAGEALNRQAKALVSQTEQPFEAALKVVADYRSRSAAQGVSRQRIP